MAKERPPREMTLRQLRRVASECAISRYSRMRKSQLLASIQEVQRTKVSLVHLVHCTSRGSSKIRTRSEDRSGGPHRCRSDLADLPAMVKAVLMPRDPQWAYTYWDIPHNHKEDLRTLGTTAGAANLRRYDINLSTRVLTVFRNTL